MLGDTETAGDVAQETFILAFRRLASFRGDSKFSSWLCRIAVNTCLNWKKSQARRSRAHQTWAEQEHVLGGHASAMSPAEEENTRRVQEALLKLNAKQRAAVVLTVLEGFNHAEAARILGCAETTVSWRLFAARAKLKRLLKPRAAP